MSTCIDTSTHDSNQNSPQRSGGPRTDEGKAASRRNSLKLGVRSKIVFPEELEALVEIRVSAFIDEFAPKSPYEELLVRDMATSSVRFERCTSLSATDLVRVANRADSFWEEDRRISVENYALRLTKQPTRIAAGLRGSRQGADWLIEKWSALADIARETGRWDDDQRRFAFDLLGTHHELRTGTGIVPNGGETAKLIAIAEREIDRHRDDRKAVLDNLSDSERALTVVGIAFDEDKATARLRKDEARARRDFAKARDELLRHRETLTIPVSGPKPQSQSRSQSQPSQSRDDRPPLSDATSNHLFKRSQIPQIGIQNEALVEETAAPEPEVSGSRPNRRARKEQARREKDAGR